MTKSLRELAEQAIKRAESATEGPWECWGAGYFGMTDKVAKKLNTAAKQLGSTVGGAYGTNSNTEFIANARTDVPTLAKAVLDLLDENELIKSRLEHFQKLHREFAGSTEDLRAERDQLKARLEAAEAKVLKAEDVIRFYSDTFCENCCIENGENPKAIDGNPYDDGTRAREYLGGE